MEFAVDKLGLASSYNTKAPVQSTKLYRGLFYSNGSPKISSI